MPSPVTESDFDISNFSGEVCESLSKLLQVNSKMKEWFGWAFTSDGAQITPEFAALFATYLYPIGGPIWWPMATIPANCVPADGRSLLRAHASTTNLNGYPELFAVYGTQYGFEDASHFNVLDLRELFLFGAGDTHPVGQEGGEETHKLIAAEIPKHSLTTRIQELRADGSAPFTGGPIVGNRLDGSDGGTTGGTASLPTSEYGGDVAHQNMPPYRAGSWVIKAR